MTAMRRPIKYWIQLFSFWNFIVWPHKYIRAEGNGRYVLSDDSDDTNESRICTKSAELTISIYEIASIQLCKRQ